MKVCENCGNEHDGEYGSGRFCSVKCSRGFSTKAKRKEINSKISKPEYVKICPECINSFNTKKKNQIYCSLQCSAISGNRKSKQIRTKKAKQRFIDNPELREKLSKTAKETNSKRIYTPLSEAHKRKISLNNKGGRTKWFEIIKPNGDKIKVQGSYEERFAKVLNKLDENWIKPTIHNREHQFNWTDENGKSHWYTPDFYSPKFDKYYETKGFWTKQQQKKKLFVESLEKVEILYIDDIKKWENTLN